MIRLFLVSAWIAIFTTSFAETTQGDSGDARVWNRFHGGTGQGAFTAGVLPSAFTSSGENLAASSASIQQTKRWSVELGSRDVGSPIIHDEMCYLVVSVPADSTIQLQARNVKTGELQWKKSFDQTPCHLHKRNTLASTTATTDDDHVYFSYADLKHTWLIAVRHQDGDVAWKRDLGTWQSSHGFGTSPRLINGRVVLLFSRQATGLDPGMTPADSRLIAVDAMSGEDVWETPLKATRSCYGIPAVYEQGGKTFLVGANTGNGLFAVDASDGKIAWEQTAFDKRCCSCPLVVDGVAIGTSGSGGGGNRLVGVKIPDDGGEPEHLYQLDKFAPYVPTPAVKDGHLFCVDDRGIASCVRASDGELIWKKRLGGNFGASPVIIGDHVLMTSLDGVTHVIKASQEYEPVNRFELAGPVGSSPAFDGKRLLLRVGETLNCWEVAP